jgi:hypothetical protein
MSLEIRKFKPGYEALGLVTDFLASEPPFGGFKASKLLTVIKYQLSLGHHVAGFANDQLVAYCGWLTTSTAQAEAWLKGEGDLEFVPPPIGNAVALTVVRVLNRHHVLPMIRACRERNRGKRVFFKRDYATPTIESRKGAVMNRG